MSTRNQRGFISIAALLAIALVTSLVLFVPNNPVGNALGVTQKPNKTVQTDATTQTIIPLKADDETLYHADGSVAMISQTVYKKEDLQIQQKVGLFDQFRGLSTIFIVLIVLGMLGVPGCVIFWNLLKNAYSSLRDWKSHTHQIVLSVDAGLATLPDDESRKRFKVAMKMVQDQEVQTLVGLLQQPAMPKGV